MRTVGNLFTVLGLLIGLASFVFGSIAATHIVAVGILFVVFGISIHVDLKT